MTPSDITRLTEIKDQLLELSRCRELTDIERRILGRAINALNAK